MWGLSANPSDKRRPPFTNRAGRPGLSLPELLVAMSLSLLVMLGVYLVYETFQANFWRGVAQAGIQQDARSALERMRRELRLAGADPSGTAQPPVQNPTSTSLEFIADPDGNNTSLLVKYDRDATTRTIRRSVRAWTGSGWGPASVTTLADHVDALTFEYFPSAAVPGLKRIRITIQVSEPVPTQPTQQHQVSSAVFLRNL